MKQTELFKLEPHHFKSVKRMNWQICVHCGLVALKNDFTEWAMKQGCNYRDHTQYQNKRMNYTQLFKE